MNCFVLLAITLGVLFLQRLGRFISDTPHHLRGRTSPTPHANAQVSTGLTASNNLLVPSALMFLCKDLIIWLWYASEIPFGPWQLLYALLSTFNLVSLTLPFLLPRAFSGQRARYVKPLSDLALIFLWFSNISVTYAVWGAFCDFCYFG